jgi:hypothetical protein
MIANAKQEVLKMIEGLPDEVSCEDIMYVLYFRQHVNQGPIDLREGKTVSHSDVKRCLLQWLHLNNQRLRKSL